MEANEEWVGSAVYMCICVYVCVCMCVRLCMYVCVCLSVVLECSAFLCFHAVLVKCDGYETRSSFHATLHVCSFDFTGGAIHAPRSEIDSSGGGDGVLLPVAPRENYVCSQLPGIL